MLSVPGLERDAGWVGAGRRRANGRGSRRLTPFDDRQSVDDHAGADQLVADLISCLAGVAVVGAVPRDIHDDAGGAHRDLRMNLVGDEAHHARHAGELAVVARQLAHLGGEGEGVRLIGDARPGHRDLRAVGPLDHREEDRALGSVEDGIEDTLVLEGLGDALHLQPVALLIDRVGDVDRDDQRHVDLTRRLGGGLSRPAGEQRHQGCKELAHAGHRRALSRLRMVSKPTTVSSPFTPARTAP